MKFNDRWKIMTVLWRHKDDLMGTYDGPLLMKGCYTIRVNDLAYSTIFRYLITNLDA